MYNISYKEAKCLSSINGLSVEEIESIWDLYKGGVVSDLLLAIQLYEEIGDLDKIDALRAKMWG
jgi:hypothetical protein